ncbi:MAG: hypothetical protein S0880_04005 [Actinomycetota bacterium]|nr:hypothetical protein [Actinomycetota bacterium]
MANNPRQPDVVENPERNGEPANDGPELAVPPENRRGHHPDQDQDKPDLDAMAEAYGIDSPSDDEQGTGKGRKAAMVVALAAGAAVGGVVVWRMIQRRRRSRLAALLANLPTDRLPELGRLRDQLPNPSELLDHMPSTPSVRDQFGGHSVRDRLPSTSSVTSRVPVPRRSSRLPFRR